ncbi:MAG TPA: hypothetical protein VGG76_02465 [Gemmatimonadaceae bacterium]|jgi:hypothetical protein
MAIDRRRFLQLSALGVAVVVADSGCAREAGGAADSPQLVSMLGAERVRELGKKYLSSAPGENNPEALREAISRGTGVRLLGRGSIDDTIRSEFAAGHTVLVDGWVLSVTEARQAALFSLTPA